MSNTLKSDPLFVGLTRPTMVFGVSLPYALLNMTISIGLFIGLTKIWILFFAAVVHGVGYLLCFREPRFIELYTNKLKHCNKCPNRSFYGANSYGL